MPEARCICVCPRAATRGHASTRHRRRYRHVRIIGIGIIREGIFGEALSEMKSVACGHDDAHLAFSTYYREIRITHVGLLLASREK